jgi:U32 family peptidase
MGYTSESMKIPEILAPAGNREHLETACLYGAEAVYLGLQGNSNLRAGARNFSPDELAGAVAFAHASGVRAYLTLNTYPHDSQMDDLPEIILLARDAGVDAVIVSDIGVLSLVRELATGVPVHLSTQANAVNSRAVRAWESLGVSRVILARELSSGEIARIRQSTGAELEIFVHGSVCISISGRCLISSYLNSRDANRGQCTQPCRWEYALVERTRPGQCLPVDEEDGHTFLYNSKDLCLLPVFDKVMGLGLDGLKIEGRNRTSLYIATVVQAYRQARDAWAADPEGFSVNPAWMEEVMKTSNREYFTGFFLDKPAQEGVNYDFRGYIHTHHLAARVVGAEGGLTVFEARNPLIEGMELEWLSKGGGKEPFTLSKPLVKGRIERAVKPGEIFRMKTGFAPVEGELVRKPLSEGDKILELRA